MSPAIQATRRSRISIAAVTFISFLFARSSEAVRPYFSGYGDVTHRSRVFCNRTHLTHTPPFHSIPFQQQWSSARASGPSPRGCSRPRERRGASPRERRGASPRQRGGARAGNWVSPLCARARRSRRPGSRARGSTAARGRDVPYRSPLRRTLLQLCLGFCQRCHGGHRHSDLLLRRRCRVRRVSASVRPCAPSWAEWRAERGDASDPGGRGPGLEHKRKRRQ